MTTVSPLSLQRAVSFTLNQYNPGVPTALKRGARSWPMHAHTCRAYRTPASLVRH